MKDNDRIDQEVRKTLNVLDGIKPAKTDDFFYSRLKARLENQKSLPADQHKKEVAFTLAVAAVLLLIVINLISLSGFNQDVPVQSSQREAIVEELATEFQILDLNYYQSYEEQ